LWGADAVTGRDATTTSEKVFDTYALGTALQTLDSSGTGYDKLQPVHPLTDAQYTGAVV
jgi:hypothetical protein